MTDPGFPGRGGGAPTPDFGAKPIIWQEFGRKVHKKKKKLDQVGGGGAPLKSVSALEVCFWLFAS